MGGTFEAQELGTHSLRDPGDTLRDSDRGRVKRHFGAQDPRLHSGGFQQAQLGESGFSVLPGDRDLSVPSLDLRDPGHDGAG